ncbi:MAG TPA: tRNA (adenosine(37)-N6)-threonylcarbamoyltransferase complex dimerization subunit type 1 TsaB [Croceibacterium sp.]
MRTLVIESATEACSAALFEADELLAGAWEVIGRGHAERLVPMIAELPGKGRADRVVVSLGPGSFTGVRIGLAAARALGLAWRAEVLGYPTLALVAAMARNEHHGPVSVCMTGGHGEWFLQDFGTDGLPETGIASVTPVESSKGWNYKVIAGSQARTKAVYEGPGTIALDILPDARCFRLLPEALLTGDLTPIYGRPPDARLPGA